MLFTICQLSGNGRSPSPNPPAPIGNRKRPFPLPISRVVVVVGRNGRHPGLVVMTRQATKRCSRLCPNLSLTRPSHRRLSPPRRLKSRPHPKSPLRRLSCLSRRSSYPPHQSNCPLHRLSCPSRRPGYRAHPLGLAMTTVTPPADHRLGWIPDRRPAPDLLAAAANHIGIE